MPERVTRKRREKSAEVVVAARVAKDRTKRRANATNAKSIPLVASAGNMFTDLSTLEGSSGSGANCKVIPAQLPRVIGVSSLGVTQQLSWFSNYGKGVVDVAAPGGDDMIPDPAIDRH